MIASLLIAASVATAPTSGSPSPHQLLEGASHAVHSGRLDQARLMIARAIAAGASGQQVDRVLADLAYARGGYADALTRYEALLKAGPGDQSLVEPAAISALKLGQVERASSLLSATNSQDATSWRLWNARGVVADLKRDWPTADQCYERAAKLAPDEAGPVNNHGWSLVLRGDWRGAGAFFEQAIALDPKSQRVANNLELVSMAVAAGLPQRNPGESDSSWAERLNDAGVAAALLGNKDRATAAFAQAIDVRNTWYARAADNLEALAGR
jgi:Flp pilus assembly protein TadD